MKGEEGFNVLEVGANRETAIIRNVPNVRSPYSAGTQDPDRQIKRRGRAAWPQLCGYPPVRVSSKQPRSAPDILGQYFYLDNTPAVTVQYIPIPLKLSSNCFPAKIYFHYILLLIVFLCFY